MLMGFVWLFFFMDKVLFGYERLDLIINIFDVWELQVWDQGACLVMLFWNTLLFMKMENDSSNDNNTSVLGNEFYVSNLLKFVNLLVVVNSQQFGYPAWNSKTIFELDIGLFLVWEMRNWLRWIVTF
jgi:hypothetical protein